MKDEPIWPETCQGCGVPLTLKNMTWQVPMFCQSCLNKAMKK